MLLMPVKYVERMKSIDSDYSVLLELSNIEKKNIASTCEIYGDISY